MSGKEKDTIGGFNSMIETQNKAEGKALVTTILFSHGEKTLLRLRENRFRQTSTKNIFRRGAYRQNYIHIYFIRRQKGDDIYERKTAIRFYA